MSGISANIDEYSFVKLLLKLAQLHEFYFDPNVRDSIKPERLNKIELSRKIVAFQNFVDNTKHKLQLYNTFPEKYSYLLPEQNIEWQKNRYYRLHEFLQDEKSWFGKFQKEEAEILWCLFAYVDVLSNELPIKYLFGPANTEANEVLNPHFLFRAYNIDSTSENQFKSKEDSHLSNLANAAFYSRKKAESHKAVDFVWMLESNRKRTDFEIERSLMYVPSGEMVCCILQWLFLIIKDGNPDFRLKGKVKPDLEKVAEIVFDSENISKISLPYKEKESMEIHEWMELWGLIKITANHYDIQKADFDLLPRAKAMVKWMSVYLKSLNCDNKTEGAPYVLGTQHEPNYWRVLALRDRYDKEKSDSAYLYHIKKDASKKRLIIEEFEDSNIEIDDEIYKEQFINMLILMVNWEEKLTDIHDGVSWKIFHHRCRFSTFIHYINRFGEKERPNTELSSEQSGLLAFPVLWDTVKEERYPVAFFMSIIKDTDKNGKSYFYNFQMNEVRKEFETKIDMIRTAIFLLAKVENIEVYQRGIRHQHMEVEYKASLTALMFSVGHFLKNRANPIHKKAKNQLEHIDKQAEHLFRITAEDIEQLSRHIKNIGNLIDILGRSIEANKSVFFNVPLSKKDNWLTTDKGEIDIKAIMNKVVEEYNRVKPEKNVTLNCNNIESLYIVSISDVVTVLPAEFFYEEILYELIINAIKNSFGETKENKEHVKIDVAIKQGKLVIGNKCKPDATISALEGYGFPTNNFDSVKRSESTKDLTGLIFIEKVLSQTDTGSIEYLVEASEDLVSAYFNTAPNFKGLKFKQNGK
ncbi:MAG: HAMP domain-containing histidine kinase [Saprospiraceae bacterium]|nr:HAMP domain-containing histidine kinase [Candidatus Defluviibacterium haderslevense]